jgi:hypothetical protein
MGPGAYWGTVYPSDGALKDDTMVPFPPLSPREATQKRCWLCALDNREQVDFLRRTLGMRVAIDDSVEAGAWTIRARHDPGFGGWSLRAALDGVVRPAMGGGGGDGAAAWMFPPDKRLTLLQTVGWAMTHGVFSCPLSGGWEASAGRPAVQAYALAHERRLQMAADASSEKNLLTLRARVASSPSCFAGWADDGSAAADLSEALAEGGRAQAVADGTGNAVVLLRDFSEESSPRLVEGSGGRRWMTGPFGDSGAWAVGWHFASNRRLVVNVVFFDVPVAEAARFTFSCTSVASVASRLRFKSDRGAERLAFDRRFHPASCGDPAANGAEAFEHFAQAVYERHAMQATECDLLALDTRAEEAFADRWPRSTQRSAVAFYVPYGTGRAHEVRLSMRPSQGEGAPATIQLLLFACM